MNEARFDLPSPHCIDLAVAPPISMPISTSTTPCMSTWCDRVAWHHSAALGLPIDRCLELDRGMAVLRTTIEYLRPALVNDVVTIATWLLPAESRLCVRRRFQIFRKSDDVTLARADIDYACIVLSSGRPSRWPPEFRAHYAALPAVLAALPELTPL